MINIKDQKIILRHPDWVKAVCIHLITLYRYAANYTLHV